MIYRAQFVCNCRSLPACLHREPCVRNRHCCRRESRYALLLARAGARIAQPALSALRTVRGRRDTRSGQVRADGRAIPPDKSARTVGPSQALKIPKPGKSARTVGPSQALKIPKPRSQQPTIGGGLDRSTLFRRRQNCAPMTDLWMENCGFATNETEPARIVAASFDPKVLSAAGRLVAGRRVRSATSRCALLLARAGARIAQPALSALRTVRGRRDTRSGQVRADGRAIPPRAPRALLSCCWLATSREPCTRGIAEIVKSG